MSHFFRGVYNSCLIVALVLRVRERERKRKGPVSSDLETLMDWPVCKPSAQKMLGRSKSYAST